MFTCYSLYHTLSRGGFWPPFCPQFSSLADVGQQTRSAYHPVPAPLLPLHLARLDQPSNMVNMIPADLRRLFGGNPIVFRHASPFQPTALMRADFRRRWFHLMIWALPFLRLPPLEQNRQATLWPRHIWPRSSRHRSSRPRSGRPAQVGFAQVGPAQVGPLEYSPSQPCPAQVSIAQASLGEIRSR